MIPANLILKCIIAVFGIVGLAACALIAAATILDFIQSARKIFKQ